MTAIMGRMATYSGKLIEWESAMNADEKLVPDNLSWKASACFPDNQGKYKVPIPGKVFNEL